MRSISPSLQRTATIRSFALIVSGFEIAQRYSGAESQQRMLDEVMAARHVSSLRGIAVVESAPSLRVDPSSAKCETIRMKDSLALYEKVIAMHPEVERKGASMPYTSLNGHMFSFLDKSGALSLRLPAEDLESFIAKYKTSLSEQHGAVMKEYVIVPHALLSKTKELDIYFAASLRYVATLKPKATTKKQPSKKKKV